MDSRVANHRLALFRAENGLWPGFWPAAFFCGFFPSAFCKCLDQLARKFLPACRILDPELIESGEYAFWHRAAVLDFSSGLAKERFSDFDRVCFWHSYLISRMVNMDGFPFASSVTESEARRPISATPSGERCEIRPRAGLVSCGPTISYVFFFPSVSRTTVDPNCTKSAFAFWEMTKTCFNFSLR